MPRHKAPRTSPGLVCAHRYGSEHYRKMREKSTGHCIYGDSPQARKQWAVDRNWARWGNVRPDGRREKPTQQEFQSLVQKRLRQFARPSTSAVETEV